MPDTPTPGQVCYAAWCAAYFQGRAREAVPWAVCSPAYQAAWEAAAQAVLAHEDRRQKHQEESLTLIDEARPFFEDAFAGVLECIELRPQGRRLWVVARVASDDTGRLNQCLRAFDETWWLANCHRSNGCLVFDYEPIAPRPPAGDDRDAQPGV